MNRFEYDLSLYPAESFKELVYFCTQKGKCSADMVPADERVYLKKQLNERGQQGWELVQMMFNQGGIVVVWKRNQG